MSHTDGHLTLGANSAGSGASLYYQAWHPKTAPKAIIMLIHGYAEHGGRYADLAKFCNGQGYAVYALDHWGHGKSDGTPGFVPKFSAFEDGVDELHAIVKKDHPDAPIILVGHSMGGLISTLYLIKNQDRFKAAILSGPAIKVVEEPSGVMLFISRLLSRIAPKMGVLALDGTAVSRDPAEVEKYFADPLVYNGKISARLASEMFNAMQDAQAGLPKITLPMLVMHGEEDRLAAVEGAKLAEEKLGSEDKLVKIYPELFHEIFNEPERETVFNDMATWLKTRV